MDLCLTLPSHPNKTCLDPLSITDKDNPSCWNVITTLIEQFQTSRSSVHGLPALIEDISVSLFGKSVDTEFLSLFFKTNYPSDSEELVKGIIDNALLLPQLFPSHTLPFLNFTHTVELTHSQVKCLLAHQFLNTLTPPKGNNWGCTFTLWYSKFQPLESAVAGYLSTLFTYLLLPIEDSEPITYSYVNIPRSEPLDEVDSWKSQHGYPFHQALAVEPITTAGLQYPHPEITCALIASNKEPGFGPACTQEELVTGSCPPLLLLGALLVSPPVPSDAALICTGTLPVSFWSGIGREARKLDIDLSIGRRTFLFLDASELDAAIEGHHGIPDLHPDIFFRDLHKAYVGLSAVSNLGITRITSPLWGAGSFGGDPVIKTIVLSLAAARAGLQIYVSVDDSRTYCSTSNPFVSNTTNSNPSLLSILQNLKADGENWSFTRILDVRSMVCTQE
ncbi:hypothetical protein CVT24_000506 [Panaeolus cyanescens]|uniref:poly(ADP-ribose) glycohydrolase n=1 Tax=Panaeolus cyanescens TaxID=181874 RepID=A0A409V8F4_9AGAR|nr:hypothetical protein CVT24_000506 [Panaeolus cyanescens]